MRQEAFDTVDDRLDDDYHHALWVDLGLMTTGVVHSNRQAASESR